MRHQFISEEAFKVIQARVSLGSARGARQPEGLKVGEPHTKDAMRNQSTEGQGNVKSGVRTHQATNGYKSKLELSWANYLQGLWALKAILSWWYEPLNLRLPGKKNFYKPDFLVMSETGLTFYEVKGRNLSDERSLVKIKTAAGLTPWAKFVLVKRIRGSWEERVIT